MLTRLIQRTALRLLSAGVFSFCSLTLVPPLAAEVDPGKARLEAINVELALLNDPSAFAQPLSVRVRGDGVEVQGTVSSEAVRQRVLEIARRNCYLPVHDRVAVAGAVSRTVPLEKSAHDQLVRELGAQADTIEIRTESGKLTLIGRVRSLEDKLHASRTLRGLPGCGGLVNDLKVKADGGTSFTLVAHADEEPRPSPLTPAAEPATRPAPVATLPSGLPTTPVAPARVEPVAEKSRWQTVTSDIPPYSKSVPRPAAKVEPVAATQLAPVAPLAALAIAQEPAPTPTAWPPAHRTMPASTPAPAGTLYQSHPLSRVAQTRLIAKPAPEVAHSISISNMPKLTFIVISREIKVGTFSARIQPSSNSSWVSYR